jgi:hypothetical protein
VWALICFCIPSLPVLFCPLDCLQPSPFETRFERYPLNLSLELRLGSPVSESIPAISWVLRRRCKPVRDSNAMRTKRIPEARPHPPHSGTANTNFIPTVGNKSPLIPERSQGNPVAPVNLPRSKLERHLPRPLASQLGLTECSSLQRSPANILDGMETSM